jgi:hypothetical protein
MNVYLGPVGEELGAFRISFVGIKSERNLQQTARCFCSISYECGRVDAVERGRNITVRCLRKRRNKKRGSKRSKVSQHALRKE